MLNQVQFLKVNLVPWTVQVVLMTPMTPVMMRSQVTAAAVMTTVIQVTHHRPLQVQNLILIILPWKNLDGKRKGKNDALHIMTNIQNSCHCMLRG
jgi:hypothetical protein